MIRKMYEFQIISISMSFDSSRLVSQLTALDREEGDIRISCGGAMVKAHSLILSLR